MKTPRMHFIVLVTGLLVATNVAVKGQSSERNGDADDLFNRSTTFLYVAIGGSLSAGVRDGGINQKSQSTSFPNLIAQQIGIKRFQQPVFVGEFQDGTGTVIVTEASGILNFKQQTDSFIDDSKANSKLPKVTGDN